MKGHESQELDMSAQGAWLLTFNMPACVRALLLSIVIVGTIIIIVPIQAVMRRLRFTVSGATQRSFCRIVCRIIGMNVSPKGFPADDKAYLIVANHISWTDIIALASVAPMTFLAKHEVSNWPLLGTLAKSQGTIFIRRGDRRQISMVNTQLAAIVRDGGRPVIFPEGTSTRGVMKPRFNSSHFEAAQLSDADIVPVAIFYTDGTGQADVGWYGDMTFLPHLWRLLKRNRFECHLSFDQAISVKGRSRKALALEAEARIHGLLSERIALMKSNSAITEARF